MGKSNTQQTSFAAGEVSPLLRGRVDVARYQSGLEQCENFVVRQQGGIWRRNGFQYKTRCVYQSAAVLLKDFVFSADESYVLEFGDTYMIVRDKTTLAATSLSAFYAFTAAATHANGTEVTTVTTTGLTDGMVVLVSSSSISSYNGLWVVQVTSGTKYVLRGCTYAGTGTADANTVAGVVSPYPTTILNQLQFCQSADTLWITHKNYKPRVITRASASSWSIAEFTTVDGPYLDYDKTNTRMTVSGITDSATLTCNNSIFVAPGDVGKKVEFMENGEWRLATITAIASGTSCTVDINDNIKLGIDPLVRLHAKATDSTRPVARSLVGANRYGAIPNSGTQATPLGYVSPLYRPVYKTPGVAPNSTPPTMVPEGIDPNATIRYTGGTDLESSHSNTFDMSDAGKVVRVTDVQFGLAASWYTITKPMPSTSTGHYKVPATVVTTMRTYTYPTDVVTLTPNSRTISATLTASAATFASSDVGRHIRLNYTGRWVFAKISAYTSSTVVTISLYDSFPRNLRDAGQLANGGITDVWRLGSWYGDDGTGNYPSCVTFHEQRLWFASSPVEPSTLWASRPQDFNKMSPSEMDGSVQDDSAINVTLGSNRVNAVKWMQSMKVLLVGTVGGEWQGRAATSITEPISPLNIAFTEETTHGSIDNCQPVKIGSSLLFLQRSGQRLRELTYSFELDSWSTRDLTVASDHILRKATNGSRLVYQNEPNSVVWILTASGDLVGLTYQREQEVFGWHYHRIGGTATVESMIALPAGTATESGVYAVVHRGNNRYIEKMTTDNYPTSSTDRNGFFYVDSGVTETMSGSSSSWSGLSHLTGLSVTVLKNGVSLGAQTVDGSGNVAVTYVNGDVLTGGMAYTSKLKVLPLQGGSPYGSADMTKKRASRVFLRVYNSVNLKLGRDDSTNLQSKNCDGASGAIYTGDVEVNANTTYSSDGVFYIHVTDPYPFILLSMVSQLTANE